MPELRTKAPLKSETKNVNLIDDINLMPRLIYIVIITNYSMHLSICKCQQSSVVNNNNINWCIPMTVCSHRDLCYRTAEFLWRSSSSTILFKARKSRTGFSGWYQVLNISENEASTVALGTFLACLINLTEKKKKIFKFCLNGGLGFALVWLFIFENFKGKFLYFNRNLKEHPNNQHLCPFILSLSLGHTVKRVFHPCTFLSNIYIFL